MKTPFQEGVHAARDGKLYCENPYPENMERHWQWLAGWTAYKNKLGEIR